MAEIYRYKGKMYVVRKSDFSSLREEMVWIIGKNGAERPARYMADVIRTLGQGVTGWTGETDAKHRDNGHRNRMVSV